MIEYLDKPWPDALLQGWNGLGWYFWDETQAYCYGPYPSSVAAQNALEEYAKTI